MRSLFLSLVLLLTCLPARAENIGKSVAEFGYDYFQKEAGDTGNVVVSPLSIHAAFAMLTLGADGLTREEALKVFHLESGFEDSYAGFLGSVKPQTGRLSLASRVWPDKAFKLKASYLSDCLKAFGTKPQTLDFSRSEEARKTINGWVSIQTEKFIENLIPSGGVDAATALVLCNALYFEGEWETPFNERSTGDQVFHTPDKDVIVPMMQGSVAARYYSDKELEVVSMGYRGSRLAMAFVVPRQVDGWKAIRPRVGSKLLETVEMDMSGGGDKVSFSVPRFKVGRKSKPLSTLGAMGLKSMLGPAPDLSKLSPQTGLKVSECFHQAVVEVDEGGTKAAAATAITVTRSMSMTRAFVTVDRPFFFVLYHRSSLAPLFIGQVLDPTS